MTVQDDERERELVRAFGLTWNRDHQRAGIDALLNIELDDLFDVCGRQTTCSVEDAKRLHKLQWTSQQYADALDTTENGRPRISQGRMLGILRLRSKYIAQRGATLNNSHVTKTHLHTFAGTSREVQVPNWAASIRAIAKEFAQAHPDHPAVIR